MRALSFSGVETAPGQRRYRFRVHGTVQVIDDEGRLRTLVDELVVSVLEAAPDHGEPEVAVYTRRLDGGGPRFLYVQRGSSDAAAALRAILPHRPTDAEAAAAEIASASLAC